MSFGSVSGRRESSVPLVAGSAPAGRGSLGLGFSLSSSSSTRDRRSLSLMAKLYPPGGAERSLGDEHPGRFDALRRIRFPRIPPG